MCRKDRGAMRMRVCRGIVLVTIHARPPVSSRTLVRQIDDVAAGATLRLKILVSVVRFRPGPPRTHKKPPSGGFFVCQIHICRRQSISGI